MAKYTIKLAKTTIEYLDIEVEADDQYDAEEKALDIAWETDEEWDCNRQDMEVVDYAKIVYDEEGEE